MAKSDNVGPPDNPGKPPKPPKPEPPPKPLPPAKPPANPGRPPVKPGPGRPADPGRPAKPGPVTQPPRSHVKRADVMKITLQNRPRSKKYDAPEDIPVRCFECDNWVDSGLAVGQCKARGYTSRWYFQMCPDFTIRTATLVDIPQVPDPEVIPDDPNNEIP